MKREIKFPYWSRDDKTQIVCQFHYEDGTILEASVTDTEDGNPDWKEIHETFTEEEIDTITNRMKEERIEERELNAKEEEERKERLRTDALFGMKLEAFEIPEVRNSKNKKLKAKIRKAQNPIEIQAYATILLMEEFKDETD